MQWLVSGFVPAALSYQGDERATNRSSTYKALVFCKIGTTEPLPNSAKPEYINGTDFKVFVPGDVPHAGYSSTTINKQ
jgi:hypothetical protein